jgi:hypothetical protein
MLHTMRKIGWKKLYATVDRVLMQRIRFDLGIFISYLEVSHQATTVISTQLCEFLTTHGVMGDQFYDSVPVSFKFHASIPTKPHRCLCT